MPLDFDSSIKAQCNKNSIIKSERLKEKIDYFFKKNTECYLQ